LVTKQAYIKQTVTYFSIHSFI